MNQAAGNKNRISWGEAISVYTHQRVITMLFLGFSAGLPFLLVFSTLSAWLSEAGVERATIGFFSWVGIMFSIKVFWAPIVDNLRLGPLSQIFGQRRSWLLLAQAGLMLGLWGMASIDPATAITQLAVFAVWVAFCSATQDICIDAFRIESAPDELQAAMAATYIFGYRLALLVAGAGALHMAEQFNWVISYQAMAAMVLVGIITTLVVSEPEHRIQERWSSLEEHVFNRMRGRGLLAGPVKLQRALVLLLAPFYAFFKQYGKLALVLLLFISCFRISDITMGVMANPFYLEMGYSKGEIANIAKLFGFFMTIFGSMVGGVLVVRLGLFKPLLFTAILVALTNLLFAVMATQEKDLVWLALVISADNLAGGMSNVAFIAYLSSLVNKHYTATQYALFSSLMTLPGKFLGGFSGILVDEIGYSLFFVYAAATGIPAVLLVLYLMKAQEQSPPQAGNQPVES